MLPSQRQSKTRTLYDVWACLNKEDGWILTANSTCMTGLGSACRHVAALLIKFDAAIHAGVNEQTAPTSELCAWKACKRNVIPAPLKSINFKKPKIGLLPSARESEMQSDEARPKHYSRADPNTGPHALSAEHLKTLHHVTPKAAFFASVSSSNNTSTSASTSPSNVRTNSDTDSDTENDNTCLSQACSIRLHHHSHNCELATRSGCLYDAYCTSHDQGTYDNLCKVTAMQSESMAWMVRRAGRITASTCHQVYNMRDTTPSQSTIATIMQYNEPFDNKYVRYGRQMEPEAKQCFAQVFSASHHDVQVKDTGFHVKADTPYLITQQLSSYQAPFNHN